MITYTNKIDIVPGGRSVVISLNQYDDDFVLVFELFARAGTLVLESGTTAAIRGTKPDGNGFSADAVLDIERATVTVTGNQQMTVCCGRSTYEITLYKNGKELNSGNFMLFVERAALDKDTPSSTSQTRELVEIEARALDIISAAEGVTSAAETVAGLSETIAENAQTASDAASEASRIAAALPDGQEFEDYVTEQRLTADVIADTVQTYTKDSSGKVTQITHAKNGTTIRTDSFVYSTSGISEIRTLATGEVLTITTNLTTLQTTITRSTAA